MSESKADQGYVTVSPNKYKTAGMLLFTSVLLVVEGVSRIGLYVGTPSGSWSGNHDTFPPIVLLVAAVGLTLYAIVGLFIAFLEISFSWGNKTLTILALVVEGVLGWFFFVSNTFAAYSFMVARLPAPTPPFNGVQSNAVIMLGMLGAIGSGVPLLGAHFFFMLQLWRQQSGSAHIYTPAYLVSRVYFYAALLILRGVSELALGSLVRHVAGSGRLSAPVVSIPFVILYPEISITDGLLTLTLGCLAIVTAAAGLRAMAYPFFIKAAFVLVFNLATYILTQIGLSPAPLVVASILTGDAIVGALMPAFLIASIREVPEQGVKGAEVA